MELCDLCVVNRFDRCRQHRVNTEWRTIGQMLNINFSVHSNINWRYEIMKLSKINLFKERLNDHIG